MAAVPLDEQIIADYIQALYQLTGIPVGKLQRYGTTNSLMNAIDHPHALELTAKQLVKVEQLHTFLQAYRVLQWVEENAKQKISSPQLAGSYFSAFLSGLKDRERFMVAFLDRSNQMIETRIISEGGIAEAPVYPRQVLKAALNCDCSSVLLAHNHPSGSLIPSREDFLLTERMVAIFEPLSIGVLDHIIIGGTGYTSLAKLGQMPHSGKTTASYEMITSGRGKDQDHTLDDVLAGETAEPVFDDEWER